MTTGLRPTPAPRAHEVGLTGDAVLFVRDWGPIDGFPVIHHHGMPSSSLAVPGGWDAPDQEGVRVLTFDRPGYGMSTSQPGRRVEAAVRWTLAIAESLGLEEFSLSGAAAGAAHAAAAAAALGERVHKLALVNGLGPDEMPGFDPAAGMLPESRHEIACARAGETELRRFLDEVTSSEDPLEQWFRHLPWSDVELMSRREVQVEDEAVHAESVTASIEGWIEDDLALFHHPWGVDLGGITAQTLLLHGLDDVLVPADHGDAYVLAVGHGQLVKLPGAGHWLRDCEPDVLRWLAAPGHDRARIRH